MMHLVAVGAVCAVEFCALMSPYPLVCEPVLWYNDGDMMNILAAGVHQLDPVLLEVPGTPLAIRWYGLAYLAGFGLGYYVLLQLSKKKLYVVEPDKLSDFVAMQVCLIGVVCGGRLGEYFFYHLPNVGLGDIIDDPTWVFRVWEGGMASHGGIIGVILVALWYARRRKLSFPAVLDGLAIVAPIGLCFGRIANYINGELYGRVCDASNFFAVKFPQSFGELTVSQRAEAIADVCQAANVQHASELYLRNEQGEIIEYTETMLARVCRENDACCNALAEHLQPRYASQLFEAFGEGLLIFAVLLIVRLKWKNAPAGLFAGLFGVIYAIARIVCECFKEPDDAVWAGVTKGQALSLLIFVGGCLYLYHALKQQKMQDLQKK